jgi:hypothetical protein
VVVEQVVLFTTQALHLLEATHTQLLLAMVAQAQQPVQAL